MEVFEFLGKLIGGVGAFLAAVFKASSWWRERQRRKSTQSDTAREIGQRFVEVIDLVNRARAKENKLRNADIANVMGLESPADLDEIVKGASRPTFELIRNFCGCFGVDPEWMRSGRSTPFAPAGGRHLMAEEFQDDIMAHVPETIYLVRDDSEAGRAMLVFQYDRYRFVTQDSVWHVSDMVGGTGTAQLVSLYRFFRWLLKEKKGAIVTGRHISAAEMSRLMAGEMYPGVLDRQHEPSHWWDDLTDLDGRWTTAQKNREAYGESFLSAQAILREQIKGPERSSA